MEVILAAAVQGTADSGTAFVLTFQANAPGLVRPRDLCIQIASAAEGSTGIALTLAELTRYARVTSLKVNGADEYIRGRNTAAPPAGIFDRLRYGNFLGLPDIRVKEGTTIKVTVIYIATGTTGIAGASMPFLPDSQLAVRDAGRMNGEHEIYVGSPEVTLTNVDGTEQELTATFDDDGLIDLGRLVIKASQLNAIDTTTADHYIGDLQDLPIFVTSIVLGQDGTNRIQGQGTTPAAPNIWSTQRRMRLAQLGVHRVSTGSTLIIKVAQYGGALLDNSSASFGVPMLRERTAQA